MPVRRKPARKARAHSKEVAGATGRTRADAPLSVVILAAGRGTRMQSDLPKVMQPLAGAPLLSYVLELASALEPASIHVVYGHGGERMREHFASAAVQWALQAEQLGTGHALLQAMPQIPADHRVLVLYGDVPLLRLESLRELVAVAGGRNLALLTARPADSSGYGRIVRDSRGALQRIVEERDATARERAIEEVNSGVLMGP